MIDKLELRQQIAAKLDAEEAARRNVNNIPEVIAAREAQTKARLAEQAAEAHFRRVFDANYPCSMLKLIDAHPDLAARGTDHDDGKFAFVLRCAVTGLPLFVGDRVYQTGSEDDGDAHYILADAVMLPVGFKALPITTVPPRDGDDNEEIPQ